MEQTSNLIFVLRPINRAAEIASASPHNRGFYVSPQHSELAVVASRGSTPATNIGDQEENVDESDRGAPRAKKPRITERTDSGPHLCFTFDQKLKNEDQGFVFGSNPKTCDILLGDADNGVSGSHFRITFDEEARLVLIDSSSVGTAVNYEGQAREGIRNNPREHNRPRDSSNDFKWILFPFPVIKEKHILLYEPKHSGRDQEVILEFSVEIIDPKDCGREYGKQRKALVDKIRNAIPFSLNIDSKNTTAGQTGSHSPKQRPIYVDIGYIGEGQSSMVFHTVDVSTGLSYAAKNLLRKGREFRDRWNTEVQILRRIQHVTIILLSWEIIRR